MSLAGAVSRSLERPSFNKATTEVEAHTAAGFTARNPQPSLNTETRLKLYRTMLECRVLEKRAYDLFMQNLIKGTSHLALGQEAVAAGFGLAMRSDDYTFCTYRGHNHTLVRGVGMTEILAELMGNSAGLMRGKGGSMHLTSVKHHMMGSYAIIGAHMTIANGAAWSAQYRGTEQVAVCFFGDGTTNIGAFHEALNFAVIWKLPVVFVCENNLYMEYTSIHDVTAVEHPAADRASAYGLEPVLIDGNDVDVVYRTAQRALDVARKGGGPSLIEAETYRHGGHSRADPGKYRPDDEVKAWLAKDPLPRYRARLLELGIAAGEIEKIEAETNAEIDRATETARNAPPPPLELADKDVWADGGSAWRN
jgi:pyruvate dehydrogenase E1 component alpha subunit